MGISWASGGVWGSVATDGVFCGGLVVFLCPQAMAVRIITINEGDEALIRVNSRKPITLEFPGCLVSVYEDNGLIFQRVENQSMDTQTQEVEEMEEDGNAETQTMDDEIQEIHEIQTETQLETQLDYEETQIGEPPLVLPAAYVLFKAGWHNVLTSQEMADIQELERDLFG